MNPNLPILLAIPFFLVFIALEVWYGKRKNMVLYRLNDAITNLNIGIGNQVFSLFIKGILLWSYAHIIQSFAIFHLEPTWYHFLSCFILFDFLFYWAHRWSHEMNFLWGAHIVHHQSEDYNLSVALRQSWIHNLIAFFIFLPIPILGYHPQTFIIVASVHTIYQFWIHTKTIEKLPFWFEFFFNTPSHHRVHHGINPQYIDKNHAGVLMIWDRIFGTFEEEKEEVHYGITKNLESWNPAWANYHYYVEMWKKFQKAPTFWTKMKVFWARPGWNPETNSEPEYQVNLGRDQYNQSSKPTLFPYILVQFFLAIVSLCAFMWFWEDLSWFYRINSSILILLTGVICGAIFENKKWVINAEYLRLFLVVLNLNGLYYQHFHDWFMVMFLASLIGFLGFLIWFHQKKQFIAN